MRQAHRGLRWVVGAALLAAPAGWAAEPAPAGVTADPVERLLERRHGHAAFRKLGRGVSNLLGGWLEIPATIHHERSERDTMGSVCSGFFLGAFRGAARTAVGAFETVTFILPIPPDYTSILPTLGYYQNTPEHERLPLR